MSKKSADRSRSARAQEALAAQERAERKRQMLVVGGVVVALVLIVVVGFLVTSGRDSTGETPAGHAERRDRRLRRGRRRRRRRPRRSPSTRTSSARSARRSTTRPATQVDQAVEDGKVKVEYRMVAFLDGASTTEYSSRALNALMVVLDTSGPDAYLGVPAAPLREPARRGLGRADRRPADPVRRAGGRRRGRTCAARSRTGCSSSGSSTPPTRRRRTASTGRPTVLIDGEPAGTTPQESAQAVLEAVA